jgi:RNA polymerase primary sigma factor
MMRKAVEKEHVSDDDDLLRSYFEQIKRTPLLTFEEEIELSKRVQQGDEAAKKRLIEANLRLVVKIAKGFVTNELPLIDLIQEGNIGLLKAASRYDYRRQVRFCTYASWWIRQGILRALSNKRRAIRIPHRKEEQIKRIQKTQSALTQRLMREPNLGELSKELEMSPDRVKALLNITTSVSSLDAETQSESGSLIDLFEDYTYSPDKILLQENVVQGTRRELDKLQSKERQILMYRFEFVSGKKYTLKNISEIMGVSPETVRQIELKAIKKLKTRVCDMKEYIYS